MQFICCDGQETILTHEKRSHEYPVRAGYAVSVCELEGMYRQNYDFCHTCFVEVATYLASGAMKVGHEYTLSLSAR